MNPGDGAIPENDKVTVNDRELDTAKLQADAKARKQGVEFSMIPPEMQARAMRKAKGNLPGKYQVASTSDVEKEVEAQSNTIDVELKA